MSLDVYLRMELDTGGAEPYEAQLFSDNVTHNLAGMAEEAGIYEHLWRPDELGITVAGDLVAPLRAGLALLEAEPGRFRAKNPSNGWGDYCGFVEFVQKYLAACKAHPKATIRVWR